MSFSENNHVDLSYEDETNLTAIGSLQGSRGSCSTMPLTLGVFAILGLRINGPI